MCNFRAQRKQLMYQERKNELGNKVQQSDVENMSQNIGTERRTSGLMN